MTSLQPKQYMASADFIQLSTPSLINAYHNELSFLWDVNMNASEEQKGLASARLSSPHRSTHLQVLYECTICDKFCTSIREKVWNKRWVIVKGDGMREKWRQSLKQQPRDRLCTLLPCSDESRSIHVKDHIGCSSSLNSILDTLTKIHQSNTYCARVQDRPSYIVEPEPMQALIRSNRGHPGAAQHDEHGLACCTKRNTDAWASTATSVSASAATKAPLTPTTRPVGVSRA